MSTGRRKSSASVVVITFLSAAIVVGACGDSNDKLLSSTSASELRSTLAQVEQQIENGDCGAAQERVSLLEQQVSSLNRVEADLREALQSGAIHLRQLVNEECRPAATETGTTDTGGTSAPDEEQSDEPGKSEGKGKGKKKGHFKDKDEDEVGGEILPDTGGATGAGGTTGSGGAAP